MEVEVEFACGDRSDDLDLAVLSLKDEIESKGCTTSARSYAGQEVIAVGFSDLEPNGDTVTLTVETASHDQKQNLKLKGGQVRPGMSGAPVVDPKSGRILGILRYTRDRQSELGGIAIPISHALIFKSILAEIVPEEILEKRKREAFRQEPNLVSIDEIRGSEIIGETDRLTYVTVDGELALINCNAVCNTVFVGVNESASLQLVGFETVAAQGIVFACFGLTLKQLANITYSDRSILPLASLANITSFVGCKFDGTMSGEAPLVHIKGSSECKVSRCLFENWKLTSFHFSSSRAVKVDGCEFVNSGFGLKFADGTEGSVTGSRFSEIQNSAVVCTHSRLEVADCQFTGCGWAGIYALEAAVVHTRKSIFSRCAYGLVMDTAHQVEITDVDFLKINDHSVVGDAKSLAISNSRFASEENCGILALNCNAFSLRSSELTKSGMHGVECRDCGMVSISDTSITFCGQHGAAIKNCDTVAVSGFTGKQNEIAGLYISDCASVEIVASYFLLNGDNGLSLFDVGGYEVKESEAEHNQLNGISIVGDSDGSVLMCVSNENKRLDYNYIGRGNLHYYGAAGFTSNFDLEGHGLRKLYTKLTRLFRNKDRG